jgi:hypothetical protein
MPALLRKTARCDKTWWAGVGQAPREETAGHDSGGSEQGKDYGDLKGGCMD